MALIKSGPLFPLMASILLSCIFPHPHHLRHSCSATTWLEPAPSAACQWRLLPRYNLSTPAAHRVLRSLSLAQIVRLVHPRDILSLIRVDKTVRSLLLRDSALGIWKGSIHNIPGPPMPAFPPGLNPAQWLNLLFGSHCNVRLDLCTLYHAR